ncbi:MAG: T9SS type A sorting domain-containing protein, partial [bacterium]
GCNVWISIDGGKGFNVAIPNSPDYNCQSLWSFGDAEQGWNMGAGIPGWGGRSDGWIPVNFNLIPYISDSIVIRWAFASDLGYSTNDDPGLFGFLIDNIVVKDGATTIFENNGEDINSMKQTGYSGYYPASWIDIIFGGGIILPNSSTDIIVKINTKNMKPGKYHANIKFSTNDTTQSSPVIPCELDIVAANHDVYVDAPSINDRYPIQSTIPIIAEISNYGLNDESNIDAICTISQGENIIYSETRPIDYLEAGNTVTVAFKSLYASEPGNLDILISAPLPGDANESNNYYCNTINITNLIDDFEIANDLWACVGPVRMSNLVEAHSGAYVLSMGSAYPYSSRTHSILTYKPGFNLEDLNYGSFSYWVQYYTDKNKDYCYIEASSDSLNWIKLDSLTGIQGYWVEHNTDLSYFINNNYPKVWMRFRFVVKGSSGLFFAIDDVSFYTQDPSSEIFVENNTVPTEWKLDQNYPNPFNPSTTINYSLPQNCFVKISIYDISGREIRVIKNEFENAGYKSIVWNGIDKSGSKVSSGVYIYSIEAKDYRAIRKMLLIK